MSIYRLLDLARSEKFLNLPEHPILYNDFAEQLEFTHLVTRADLCRVMDDYGVDEAFLIPFRYELTEDHYSKSFLELMCACADLCVDFELNYHVCDVHRDREFLPAFFVMSHSLTLVMNLALAVEMDFIIHLAEDGDGSMNARAIRTLFQKHLLN
ncbi:MAG TPA: hypothetical protein VD884_17495 [Ohtaekwangia sp.]|nr:hypothetical protein [Ohtaekwangia sp.]